jgi:glycosyltransferase involved in cell wall biosynthesis
VQSGADPEHVVVLLNGIDPGAFTRDPSAGARVRQALGIASHALVVGAVGRLEPQKRFDILLLAFNVLRRARPEARLLIVGDGSLRSVLEAQAEALGLDDTCRFLGHRGDIVALHSAFDVFVQSSDYEGTPNAVLEAMAMETPLVATGVGGTSELATHDVHALIVAPGDPVGLANAMETVLADPGAARRRALAARPRGERHLSVAGRTRALEGLYDRLVGTRVRVAGVRSA